MDTPLGAILTGGFPLLQKASDELKFQEVKITLPTLGEVTLAVDDSQEKVAWVLFIETITRMSTQPLESDRGFLREALASLYELFTTTRKLLGGMEPSGHRGGDRWTVEMLAVAMLNQELRPFLSQWHPKLSVFASRQPERPEAEWESNEDCRVELEALRVHLRKYARGFGELAGVAKLDHFFPEGPGITPNREKSRGAAS